MGGATDHTVATGLNINIQELRALVDEIDLLIQQGPRHTRVVVFVDSRVAVGAVSKG